MSEHEALPDGETLCIGRGVLSVRLSVCRRACVSAMKKNTQQTVIVRRLPESRSATVPI